MGLKGVKIIQACFRDGINGVILSDWQTKTDTYANSVDPDETAHVASGSIRLAILFFDLRLKPLFSSTDMSIVKDGRVHFRNSGTKGLHTEQRGYDCISEGSQLWKKLLWKGFWIINLVASLVQLGLICSHIPRIHRIYHTWAGTRKKGTQSFPVCSSSNGMRFALFWLQTYIVCLKLPQCTTYLSANGKGSGETALMRSLAWAFDGRLCDK